MPRRQRGHQRVAALLEAADRVFAERGRDAATMTEIAGRAGAAIGSLYQFFPTKEALVAALLEQYARALATRLDALTQAAPAYDLDELAGCLLMFLANFRAEHPGFAALAEAMVDLPVEAGPIRAMLRERLAAILAARHRQLGKAASLPPARLAAIAAAVLQVMKAGIAVNTDTGLADRAAVLEELRTMLRDYLAAC